ncbi:hypothetical protein [Marinobacter sp. S6332]|uniref:hypothetical protein n=1 Tax=Marinobacter sp. S6332 TaxID=2926403 RepID=UPI001FF27A23|nr:hypothetical protein [Marinobacter sp. S6332]MCK0163145.1 hypothetical protein [Marinobacter sp. S6332]
MDADNRSATLVLRNTSQGARTYRLMWEDKRVNEAGNYVMVEPDQNWPSASGMIRFSPRQITVGPGENQTVRLNFRPPADLKPGEYRSHLKLQVIGEESEPAGVFEMDDPDREGVSFRLFMQMSFSIPVIARYKVSAPEVKIADVAVVPATNQTNMALAITLERTGEASSSGDLIVEMQRNANSPVERIGSSKEVSVFHETSRKIVKVSLRDSAVPAGAWIRVAYEGSGEYKGRLWDERVFQSK